MAGRREPGVTRGVFRLALPDGSVRLASGEIEAGPAALLERGETVAAILRRSTRGLAEAAATSSGAPVPTGSRILAPVDDQEIWAAGVTYERSRDARMDESAEPSVYDHVYDAERPELFFKSPGWRIRGPGERIGIRADSAWDVPEPELAVVVAADLTIAGFTIGNDVSSRTIEGENPLYLPQAKFYDGSCALGPALVPASEAGPPFPLRLLISRDGAVLVDDATTTARIRRPLAELVEFLGRALELPAGAVLLTGTGIVPEPSFTLREGDVVRIEAGPLGALENTVALVGSAASSTAPQAVRSP
ncbi:MAG: fumarylacetoacetate hydrolase [Chloroflexi bacterium]|nr:MAG: fumarylacetoacetate hydrolase [Chloroflexota bacterium]